MKFRICVKKNIVVCSFLLFILGVFSGLLINIYYDVTIYSLIGACASGTILLLMIMQIFSIGSSNSIKCIIVIRMLIGVFLAFYMSNLALHGVALSDEGTFLEASRGYFLQRFSDSGYYNAYYESNHFFINILVFLFSFFGDRDLFLRIFFLYVWFLGYLLIEKVATKKNGREFECLIAFYAFMPWEIWIQSNVLREPFIQIGLMLSLYFLWHWMNEGRFVYIVLSAMGAGFSTLLHPGNGMMFGVILLTYLFWDTRKKMWRLFSTPWKSVLILIAIVCIPSVFTILHHISFPRMAGISNMTDLISIASRGAENNSTAHTYYMAGVTGGSISIILYRMFYFWASPTPRFWYSISQVIAFLCDTAIWIMFLIYMVRRVFIKKVNKMGGVFVLILMLFTFIYGLGTNTGGTAMRHRGQLLGVLVMCAVMGNEKRIVVDEKVSINCR